MHSRHMSHSESIDIVTSQIPLTKVFREIIVRRRYVSDSESIAINQIPLTKVFREIIVRRRYVSDSVAFIVC